MTESLTYIELDIPFCQLNYGELPCGARLPTDDDPVVASFDGSTTFLKRAGGLTGASDSKSVTFSFWVNLSSDENKVILAGASALNGATQRGVAIVLQSGFIEVGGWNSAGTVILDQKSSVLPLGRWVHVLGSFDLSNAARKHLYIDDVSDLTSLTFTDDTIDFTIADWGIGAMPNASLKLDGPIADLWFAPGVYLDLSNVSNRRKFVTATRGPVSLGSDGSVPTGSAPLVFMSGTLSSWHTNKGAGGGFTLTGGLVSGDFATGDIKCFNSIKTCQDRLRFDEGDVTLRFAKPTDYLPAEIEAIPSISTVDFTPAIVSLGVDIGQRATLSVSFKDHPHSDTGEGYDKYLSSRDYDPYLQGTYWGKFRARQPFLRGRSLRWITGIVGDDLSDMETRHFIIDSFDGPTPDGVYRILAKDVLKLADGDRAQCPVLSNGFLSADITASETAATLLPAGIGDEEYPATGLICIGGNEIVSFTRSGDSLTIARAVNGSSASSHKAQDRCQLVKNYSSVDPAFIINDLLVNFAGVPAEYIVLGLWFAETDLFLGNLYSANICEPTSVAALISELIEQAALVLWWDEIEQLIKLQVLRAVTTDAATFTPDNTLQKSLKIKEQPNKRISRVQVYFGQIDPTKPLSNLDNYRSTSLSIDNEAESDYGAPSIKTILSRWIPAAGRSVADRLGEIQLSRYRDPPRHIQLELMRYANTDASLGVGYRIESFCLQDATGSELSVPVQITSLNPRADRFSVEAEEMLWTASEADSGVRYVILDSNSFNINLRTSHDSIYTQARSGDVVNCIINAGVVVGSTSVNLPALTIGSWDSGVVVNVQVLGKIQGTGGAGGAGDGGGLASPGEQGGTALYTRYPINFDVVDGQVWAGGGGGGGGGGSIRPIYGNTGSGGGGGGGAGTYPGQGGLGGAVTTEGARLGASPGTAGSAGSATSGGAPGAPGLNATGAGQGGSGGGPGIVGGAGSGLNPGAGGNAGAAIDGVSYVTVTAGPGDIRGFQIN